MKFTIPAYLVLLACLANVLALPMEEGTGVAIHDQNSRTKADSFAGAYARLTEPGKNTPPADVEPAILFRETRALVVVT